MATGFKSKGSKTGRVSHCSVKDQAQEPAQCHFYHVPLVKAATEPIQTQGAGPGAYLPREGSVLTAVSYFLSHQGTHTHPHLHIGIRHRRPVSQNTLPAAGKMNPSLRLLRERQSTLQSGNWEMPSFASDTNRCANRIHRVVVLREMCSKLPKPQRPLSHL